MKVKVDTNESSLADSGKYVSVASKPVGNVTHTKV